MKKPIEVASVLLIDDDNRLCVSRRGAGLTRAHALQTPGGRVEPGEYPLDAAARELREETGLDLPASRFSFLNASYAKNEAGEPYVVFAFRVHLRSGEVPQVTEPGNVSDEGWFFIPIDEIADGTEKLCVPALPMSARAYLKLRRAQQTNTPSVEALALAYLKKTWRENQLPSPMPEELARAVFNYPG